MKKKTARRVLAFLLVLVMLTMASCDKEMRQAASNTVTFTDALGREVSVAKEPERVAALIGSFGDVWVLSGGTLCAAPEEAWTDYKLELPDAVDIGGAHSPNLELLLASDPDFVIASASTASNVEMLDVLESAPILPEEKIFMKTTVCRSRKKSKPSRQILKTAGLLRKNAQFYCCGPIPVQ